MQRTTTPRLLLLALIAGGAVMVLEIAAPRLVAPHAGTGALVWTVTIATFLGGLALGNALGGRLADRLRAFLLPTTFLAGALLAALTRPLHDLALVLSTPLPHAARTFVYIALAFLPVSVVLGMAPPALAQALLRRGTHAGLRVGAIGAAGAIGSVAGTLLAGFFVVPAWGLTPTFFAVAAALLLAALVAPWRIEAPAARPVRTPVKATRRTWFWLAGLAGAALLALEITAGRMASDRLGSSVYTWTSVIGVVLAGLSLGGLVGGALADRIPPRRLLPWAFLAASITSLLLLWARPLLDLADVWADEGALTWAQASLAVSTLVFLLPAAAIGALSPIVIRGALAEPTTDGRVVGGLYAAGTLGAVAAAVLLGGILIPWAGLERIVLFLAFVLASAAGSLRRRQPYAWFAILVVIALGLHGPWEETRVWMQDLLLAERVDDLVVEDSRYSRIRVREIEERSVVAPGGFDMIAVGLDPTLARQGMYSEDDGRLHWRGPMSEDQMDVLLALARTDEAEAAVLRLHRLSTHRHRQLLLDRLVHGYVDLHDPTWLGYGYERLYAAVLAPLWPEGDTVRCFFIGGGAYAFQGRLLALHGDGVRCVTAEIDPMVTSVARDWLGLEDDPRHEIVHKDARTALQAMSADDARFDLVFGDAFDDIAVPFHLTTHEFASLVKSRMAPDGRYLVNVVDSWDSGRFLGAFVSTLRKTFRHVKIVSTRPRILDMRDTYVVVASDAVIPLETGRLQGEDGEMALVCSEAEVDDLCLRAGRLVLTDERAPVEILLAPVLHTRRQRVR